MPVDLLLQDRSCLVVGGGPIAARKVGHLLDSGARITVVGKEVVPAIQEWLKKGCIRHRPHDFRESDLKGAYAVFAATNSDTVNGRVLRLCRREGILSSSVDANWTNGDFVTPATARHPGLILTVSTGGQSCRRARLVKDYLSRHVPLLGDIEMLAVGAAASAGGSSPGQLGALIHRLWGVHEFVIVKTRAELAVLAMTARDRLVQKSLVGLVTAAAGAAGKAVVKRGASAMAWSVAHPEARRLPAALDQARRLGWAGVMMREWIGSVGTLNTKRDQQRRHELIIRGFQSRNPVE